MKLSWKINLLQNCLVLTLIGISHICIGQEKMDAVFPSPNAAALMEYANIPVSYYTGTPKIDIPLLTLPGRNLDIPISISYHASGIKVRDISSWVGLGWNLNAGGAITRVVRSIHDDDEERGYSGDNKRGKLLDGPITQELMYKSYKGAYSGKWDYEPDTYFFKVNGLSGRFTLDADGNTILLPYQDIKIVKQGSSNDSWVIQDKDGVKYTFGLNSNEREKTTVTDYYHKANGTPDSECDNKVDEDIETYTSTWHLSKIEYMGEEIDFTYSNGESIGLKQYQSTKEIIYDSDIWGGPTIPSCGENPNYACVVDYVYIQTTPKYLSSISNDFGSVVFSSVYDRIDLNNGNKLEKIVLKNKNPVEVKAIKLNYSYFQSASCTTEDCYRLKLETIEDITKEPGVKYRQFEYYEDQNLPSRYSNFVDHWGYYNHNTIDDPIPYIENIYEDGATRNPNLSKCRANTLKKITNASGGETTFEFQLHNVYNAETYQEENVGGLRISKITESESINPSSIKETIFSYKFQTDTNSSGILFRMPVYNFDMEVWNEIEDDPNTIDYTAAGCYRKSHIINSTSPLDLYDVNGYHVGYSHVEISYSDGSRSELSYKNYDSQPDVYDANDFFLYNAIGGEKGINIDPYTSPFSLPSESRFWARGLIEENSLYGNNGDILEKTVNEYDTYEPTSSNFHVANGLKAALDVSSYNSYAGLRETIRVGLYELDNKGIRLSKSTHYQFDQLNDTKSTKKIQTFSYDDAYPTFISTDEIEHSDGTEVLKKYRYPFNFSATSGVLWDMAGPNLNMLNYPVEVVTKINNKVVHAIINDYQCVASCQIGYAGGEPIINSGIIKPKFVRQLRAKESISDYQEAISGSDVDSRCELIGSFELFDDLGNILQFHGTDMLNHSLIWGYDNTYVVAKIDGASYLEVEGVSGFGSGFSLGNNGLNSSKRTNLRNELTKAHVTIFEYEPLKGMTKRWDPNGQLTTYEYDQFNRLKLIKDDNGNIVERYRYKYASEDEVMNSDYEIEDCKIENIGIEFNSGRNYYGGTKYIWDFGDGTVLETSDNSVSHTYASTGTYETSLTLVNPEHPTVQTTKITTILLPANAYTVSVSEPSTSNFHFVASKSASQGYCGVVSYQWEKRTNSTGSWTGFGENSAEVDLFTPWENEIRVLVTDNLGTITSSVITINPGQIH